ncbi:MAG: PQQ-like beta-propeller repeat protein, partial [Planctomycetes bacterium]|nr:PQQ-like beta-propeller repeat protein [Planctomycetota bacterium]
VHGNGGSPILVGENLVMACDGGDVDFIAAINKNTGKVAWKTDRTDPNIRKKFAFGTPLLIEVDGEQQIVSQASGYVYSYNPKGELIWKVNYNGGYSVIPRPVFAHGLVFVSSSYDSAVLYAIDPTGKGDVTDTHVKWTLKKGAPHTPSPVVVGNEIYVVSDRGIATCCDAKTGEVHWQERIGGKYSSSLLAADGHIYIQDEEGKAIIIEPGTAYKEVARNKLEPRTFASYAVSGTSLFIRTEKQLYRIQNAE